MSRRFFDWLQDWIFEDDNVFIGLGKIILVVVVVVGLFVAPLVYLDATAPSFSLKKDEWACVQSHEETHMVLVGKIWLPRTEMVCDVYQRR